MNIFIILVIGSFIGWVANLFIYGHGLGLKGDMATGILGSFVGLFVYSTIRNLPLTVWEAVGISIVGAATFLLIVDLFTARRNSGKLI